VVLRSLIASLLLVALASPSPLFAAPAPPLGEAPIGGRDQRIAELRERLVQRLEDSPLARTRIGMIVVEARDGEVLFEHNASQLFNPASTRRS